MKRTKQGILSVCACMAAFCAPVHAFEIQYDNVTQEYTGSVYELVVNERLMDNLPLSPIIFNDRALVPVREIFEEMGAEVSYTGETKCVEIEYENTYVRLFINDNAAYINGKRTAIPDNVVPKLITRVGGETKTMVPLRFISETIGMDVVFDGEHNTILVNSPDYYASLYSVGSEPAEPSADAEDGGEPAEFPADAENGAAPAEPFAEPTEAPEINLDDNQATPPLSAREEQPEAALAEEGITGADLNTEFIMQGVDVSHWQNDIDWESVKDEIDFAILSVGYGQNYTSQDDKKFFQNADACTYYGIPFGVYIYSYAMDVESAASEADHVLRLLQGYELSFPIYYDLEEEKQGRLPSETLGEMARVFCDKVQAAGYEVGIYANTNWWTNILTDSAFENPTWYKWVAQYNTHCTYTGTYTMWQYSAEGKVSGIEGNVDMNYWYGKKRAAVLNEGAVN